MYNEDSGIRMIAASERRKPWLSTLLAILLAAPGIPISGAPGRDAASLGIRAPGKVRVGARDATRVGVSLKGRDRQIFKNSLVTLFLVSKPGGPGLVSDSGEVTVTGHFDADGKAWFPGLRSNGIVGAFEIVAKVDGPDGRVIDKRKTIRSARKGALAILGARQLSLIAAGAAVVATVVVLTTSSTSTPPTVITPGPPVVTTGRKPRR